MYRHDYPKSYTHQFGQPDSDSEEIIHGAEKMIPRMKGLLVFIEMKQNKTKQKSKTADSKKPRGP